MTKRWSALFGFFIIGSLMLFGNIALAQTPTHPFPAHTPYAAGSIKPSNVSQTQMDSYVGGLYDSWKSRYIKAACSPGQYYVYFDEPASDAGGAAGTISISEGQGYGMMITAFMAGHDANAQTTFDGLFRYYKQNHSDVSANLMGWDQVAGCVNAAGGGGSTATDGDLDIAYSLLLADKQWGSAGTINYLAEAKATIAAIKQYETNQGIKMPTRGDWAQYDPASFNSTRPSDFMTDHFKAFQSATGDTAWGAMASAAYTLAARMQSLYSSTTGLLPDFIDNVNTTPVPSGYGTGSTTEAYSSNACRIPWRMGLDFLVNGDTRAVTALSKMNAWLKSTTGGNVNNLSAGYYMDGRQVNPGWNAIYFTAPYAVGAMTGSANQTWLNTLWSNITAYNPANEQYYGNCITLLNAIAISGNWWSPATASPSTIVSLPSAPALTSPATGATGTSTQPTMQWNAVNGATGYRLQVSTSSTFTSTVFDNTGLTSTSVAVSPALSSGTTYYWRVNAANSSGSGSWSTVNSFATAQPTSGSTTTGSSPIWVSAYYAGWMQGWQNTGYLPAEKIDYSTVTHIMHFGLIVASNGSLDDQGNGVDAYNSNALVTRVHAAGKKAIIVVGGASSQAAFRSATATASTRSVLVNNLITIMKTRGYDGIDIDWEPMDSGDISGYAALATDLRAQMDLITPRPQLTTALGPDPSLIASVQSKFDQINIMTYDLAGAWPGWVTWHNSSLGNGGSTFPGTSEQLPCIQSIAGNYVSGGITTSKIGVGIDFYGYIWSGGSGTPTGGATVPRQSWSTAPSVQANVPYYTIMSNYYQASNYRWDSTSQASYLSIDNTGSSSDKFIPYDDEKACTAKINYVKSKGMGGVIIWELGGGYRSGQPIPDNLLQAIKNAAFGSATATVPSAPSLTSVANGTSGVAVNPSLSWSAVSGATSYRIQIAKRSTFDTLIVNAGGLVSASYVPSLSTGTTYYWRVCADNSTGSSPWSAVWNFATKPAGGIAAPALISVASGATNLPLIDTLRWGSVTGAKSYRLQVSRTAAFDNIATDANGLTGRSYRLAFTAGKTYYWRVLANDSTGAGPWSAQWSFSIQPVPAAPTLLTLTNGSTGASATPALSWSAAAAGSTYRLQISRHSNFDTLVTDQPGLPAAAATPSLATGSTYYWRVCATSNTVTGPWSSVWSFSTGAPGTVASPDVWASQDGLASPWINASWSATPTFNSTDFVYAGQSAIKVVQGSTGGLSLHYGSWSSTAVISPASYQAVEFAVYGGPNGVTMNVMLENNAGYTFPIISCGSVAANTWKVIQVPMANLNPNAYIVNRVDLMERSGAAKTYYVDNIRFIGAATAPAKTVATIGAGDEQSSVVPDKFSLMQNYPNPFNPVTTIRYALPADAEVKLTVYSMLGQEVAQIVNERQNSGYHEASFDGSSLASGTYIYRLSAVSPSGLTWSETKKLQLIK